MSVCGSPSNLNTSQVKVLHPIHTVKRYKRMAEMMDEIVDKVKSYHHIAQH